MSGIDKMDGVPVFLKHLSKDMFICGKSINLLKLCCPQVRMPVVLPFLFECPYGELKRLDAFLQHYICDNAVDLPAMNVVYSLSSLQQISESSQEYAEKMRKLQANIQVEWKRKVSHDAWCTCRINIQDHEKFRFLSQKNEEALKQEQLAARERQKASKALAEIEGCQAL